MRRLVRQDVLTNTCTKVASGLANVAGITASTQKFINGKNKDIVILKPDKGNGVAVMDRIAYEQGIFAIVSDTSKFKANENDPTLQRYGKFQRLVRALKIRVTKTRIHMREFIQLALSQLGSMGFLK